MPIVSPLETSALNRKAGMAVVARAFRLTRNMASRKEIFLLSTFIMHLTGLSLGVPASVLRYGDSGVAISA